MSQYLLYCCYGVYCPARIGAVCWWAQNALPGAGEAVNSSLIILQVACYVEGDAPESARCILSG